MLWEFYKINEMSISYAAVYNGVLTSIVNGTIGWIYINQQHA